MNATEVLLYGLLIVVAIVGLVNAVYNVLLMARAKSDGKRTVACPAVMMTKYARLMGFPNAYLALAFYSILIAFSVARLTERAILPLWPLLIASGIAMGFSVYLLYVLFFVLKKT